MYPQVREMASVFDPTGLVPVLCEHGIPTHPNPDIQDIADGQALRELDAAHGGTWSLHVVKQMSGTVGFAIEAWHRQTKVFGKPDDEMPDVYPTIAAAADACRAAIEATR